MWGGGGITIASGPGGGSFEPPYRPVGSSQVCAPGLDAFSCNLVHILSKNYI